jgi:hypothetical protein
MEDETRREQERNLPYVDSQIIVYRIHFDCDPTSFEEGFGETIRSGAFITRYLVDGIFTFL